VPFNRTTSSGRRGGNPAYFDALEPRLALYTSPLLSDLPSLDLLSHPENTVVRMQTSAGFVDIELYDVRGPGSAPAAPITTANFLAYINRGRYEETFFHRLVNNFVLQGGAYQVDAGNHTSQIPTEAPIQNEFNAGRSNIERTIAMAKLTGDPNSATSQFFFNIADNSENLDNQNGGFTVFGRVIQGWDVITTIAGLTIRDLNSTFTGQGAGNFGAVPVHTPGGTDVVRIMDMEVIKAANSNEFYSTAVYFPDGYRSARIVSNLDLVNPDPNGDIRYEVIARFENGSRDRVITSGTLIAGARVRVPVSRGGDPSINNVRAGTPFAYEVRATGAIGASLSHKDFGAIGEESFVNPGPLRDEDLREWTFAFGQKGPGVASFLTWTNLAGTQAFITATFYGGGGAPTHTISVLTAAYRRGGLNVGDMAAVPDGLYSVILTSTQPIVAGLSQYRAAPARASLETGQLGGAATDGVLPGALIPSDGQSLISLFYPGASPSSVVVNFEFVLADGTVLTGTPQTLTTNSRRLDFDLSLGNGALPRDEYFSVRYRVQGATAGVSAAYTSITAGDTIRTDFQTQSTSSLYFAGGFLDPTQNGEEVLSLFNPFTGASGTLTYRIRIHFVDAEGGGIFLVPADGEGTIAPGGMTNISIRGLSDILSRIGSAARFRRYSITVESSAGDGGPTDSAIFGQLTRVGPGGEIITTGPTLAQGQTAFPLTFPRFSSG
jgi:cyclophilin family peptidyl-prolyl cis-trans isomerase